MWDKDSESRYLSDFPLFLPHEAFAKYASEKPEEFTVALFDPSMLPPTYHQHPVTQAKGQLSVPIGYFSDAVPHTKSDSFCCLLLEQHFH
jgi:hypothetical protein